MAVFMGLLRGSLLICVVLECLYEPVSNELQITSRHDSVSWE